MQSTTSAMSVHLHDICLDAPPAGISVEITQGSVRVPGYG